MFSAGTLPADVSLPCSAAIVVPSALAGSASVPFWPHSVDALGLQGLQKGEPLGVHPDLVDQGDEPGRRVPVKGHLVVVGEFGEHDRTSVTDVQRVLDQG